MKNKSTKRALIGSVVAIVLCAVMLIGTTFAWFTDTASTGVNKIQAGNLKIDIVDEADNSIKGQKLEFTDKNNNTDILWEPGVTFKTPAFKIKNVGNLALKYKLSINGVTGDSDLLKVITFSVVKEDGTAVDLDTFEGHLTAEVATSEELYIQGHMAETAGNEYQGLSLEGVGITVYATQDTVESDSYNNQYDKDAKYTEEIAKGKSITSGTHTITTGVTASDKNAIAVKVTGDKTNVTIEDGTFDGGSGGNNQSVHVAGGAKVTIKDGTFTVGADANGYGNSVIESNGGNIVIEGGFFYTNYSYGGKYYVLNQNNSNPGTITVKGGTFVNYDPSKGDDYLGGNFVADGYKVVSEAHGEDTWYTVVPVTNP